MTDIFRASKPVAQIPHNGFDKSRRDVFSSKCAMLTPCFIEDVYPDSKYQVDMVDIVRIDSIQSAPFARMSQNVEYFFVPYQQIWRDFERFYYERGDIQRNPTNAQSPRLSTVVPCVQLNHLLQTLFLEYCLHRVVADIESSIKTSEGSLTLTIQYRLNFLHRFFNDYYYDRLDYPPYGTLLIKLHRDVHQRYCVEDILRNLDMLGYGNYLPAFKSYYIFMISAPDIGDEISDLINIFNTVDVPPVQTIRQYVDHLLDLFNQPSSSETPSIREWLKRFDRRVSVFRAAAYLKVWSDYYRNSQYDVDVNYAYYFNFDWLTGNQGSLVDSETFIECLIPRYRQWKKDVFTGGFPNAQFGSVSVAATNNPVTISNPSVGQYTVNAQVLGQQSYGSDSGRLALNSVSNSYWNIDSSVSALALRQALAMQRYKERILRAGNRIPNLQRAVFGDSSRYISDEYVDFIGAVHSSIDFNTVASTAEVGSQNVGDLSSNGVSTHGGRAFNYHVHDFGVIIGLFYVLPESEYENFGVDRMVTLTESYDFYKPDFANLGLSPVFNFDFNIQQMEYGGDYDDTQLPDSVIGYLARYWQYKTAIDKVHGEFYGDNPIGISSQYIDNVLDVGFAPDGDALMAVSLGAFANYVTPRRSQDLYMPNLAALYCNPEAVDRIFYHVSDTFQSSDQFKVNMNHDVKAILPMSVIGLPQ